MVADTMTADPTATTLTFDDLFVLSTGGVDVFVYDMLETAELPQQPPYYVTVDGRRFAFSGMTFLEHGHGAVLPRWVREEEAAGHLTLFVRRNERLMGYVHAPAAVDEDDEDGEGEAEGDAE